MSFFDTFYCDTRKFPPFHILMGDIAAITDLENEINQILEAVAGAIAAAKKGSNQANKDQEASRLQNRLNRATKALQELRIEIRELPRAQQQASSTRSTKLQERVAQLALDLTFFLGANAGII
jgi:uncharacterized protein YlxW (UPF0749 family)